jgi:tRNA (cmo5U34)-methyltransferase
MTQPDFQSDWGNIYNRLIERIIPGYSDFFLIALTYLKEHLKPGSRVLVVGAGGGTEVVKFAQQPWTLIGVDPSPRMLEIAQNRWQSLTSIANLELICGEVADIPSGAKFDAATCCFVMHFLPDDGSKDRLLRDIASRLNPGAPYIHADAYYPVWIKSREHGQEISHLYLETSGALADKKSFDQYMSTASKTHLVYESRMIDLFEAAGFTDIWRVYQGFYYGGWCMRHGLGLDEMRHKI